MAKITQGIGKKLNPSEARASISLHKIAQKKPALVVYGDWRVQMIFADRLLFWIIVLLVPWELYYMCKKLVHGG